MSLSQQGVQPEGHRRGLPDRAGDRWEHPSSHGKQRAHFAADERQRPLYASLTKKGKKAAKDVFLFFEKVEKKALQGFSPEAVDCLERLLTRLYGNFEKKVNDE